MAEFYGFRFNTQNGFDHLACALAANAVADNHRTRNPLKKGSFVVVLAKKGDRYMATVAVAQGSVLDVAPQDIWDDWAVTDTVVHGVEFKTKPVFLPADLGKMCSTTNIKEEHAEELAYYCFANG